MDIETARRLTAATAMLPTNDWDRVVVTPDLVALAKCICNQEARLKAVEKTIRFVEPDLS